MIGTEKLTRKFCAGYGKKSQIPRSKSQAKSENTKWENEENVDAALSTFPIFSIWSLLGIWDLGLGI
jgi:hypothetical protein